VYLMLALTVLLELRPAGGVPSLPVYYLIPMSLLAWFRGPRPAILAGSAAFLVTLAASLWGGTPARDSAAVFLARLLTFAVGALLARGLRTARLMLDFVHRGAAWRTVQKPVRVGARLLVIPALAAEARGDSIESGPGDLVLYIQPGLAFGTSSHPTTRMCLELLEQHMQTGFTVLDVGCGTGVLAIAAAKLGAVRVHAIDIDPGAIQVARTNLAYNQVTDRVTLHQGSIEVFISENPLGGSNAADSASHPAPSSTRIQFDLILANVLAGAIRELLQAGLSQLLGKEGVLIASGVRSNELGSVEAAMLATGLRLDQSVEKEGWCALAARRDQPVDLQSTQQAPPPNNSLV
jgi:ribosomal protein L11 methyltransferase